MACAVLCRAAKALIPRPDQAATAWRTGGGNRRVAARRKSGAIALVCCLTISAPTGLQAQTLTQALADTYSTNPQLLAQRALLRATDEQVPQALANWRPTVNFTGQAGYATTSEQTAHVAGLTDRIHRETRPNSLSLTATQPVYSGGRTVAQTSQAINTVEAARAQTLATETTVFQAVVQAYLDVVRDQALVEVNRNNVAVLRKQLDADVAARPPGAPGYARGGREPCRKQ